jgi:hypothetical protein
MSLYIFADNLGEGEGVIVHTVLQTNGLTVPLRSKTMDHRDCISLYAPNTAPWSLDVPNILINVS